VKESYFYLTVVVLSQAFSQTSMAELRQKSKLLTAYTEHLLLTRFGQPASEDSSTSLTTQSSRPCMRIITPSDPEQRGSQLSIWFSVPVGLLLKELAHRGVVVIHVYCKNTCEFARLHRLLFMTLTASTVDSVM